MKKSTASLILFFLSPHFNAALELANTHKNGQAIMELRRGYDAIINFKHEVLNTYAESLNTFIENIKEINQKDYKLVAPKIAQHLYDLIEMSVTDPVTIVWYVDSEMKVSNRRFSSIPQVNTTLILNEGAFRVVNIHQYTDDVVLLVEKTNSLL